MCFVEYIQTGGNLCVCELANRMCNETKTQAHLMGSLESSPDGYHDESLHNHLFREIPTLRTFHNITRCL